ncbi:unnamed protein product [Toxocara canis]|uniref:Uncharacterized protein n=1 Tax=Toxocara canis TaxID=6265 RepID=A0A183UGL3_TOXCA|nr:unnamed protein product [Toxocara canis]
MLVIADNVRQTKVVAFANIRVGGGKGISAYLRVHASGSEKFKKKLMSGGIAKETKLTAIEKRRRMIEAGRKYATLNGIALHSNAISKQPTHFKEGDVELVAPSALANQTQALGGLKDMVQVEKELECEPKSVRKSVLQHKPPHFLRARERPSLFPNGINPLDEASTARYHRLPQSQRSPKELKTFSAFVRPLACATNASPSQTPSSSNKSVHFSDKITFRSPPLSCLEKLPQLPEVLNLNVSDSELDAQLSELPSGIISRLNDALQRIHTERSARNSERGDRLGSEESTPTEEGSAECLARKRGRPKRQTRSVKADELYPWSAVKVGNVAEEERNEVMKLLPNVIILIIVPGVLAIVLLVGPTAIVGCEWRKEQIAIENGMSTAIRLKALREEYIGRAVRAFNYSTYTYREVKHFLKDYMAHVQPLYAEYLTIGRVVEIGDTTDAVFTFPNALALLVSYAITTGHTNVDIRDAYGQSILAIFAYIGTIVLSIIIASMCQTYNCALRFLFAKIVRLDESTTNPDRVSYKYMWAVAKRDGLVLLTALVLLVAVIAAGYYASCLI